MIAVSQESTKAQWILGDPDSALEAARARDTLTVTGKRSWAYYDFAFQHRDGFLIPSLRPISRNGRTSEAILLFAKLPWSRFLKMFSLQRKFLRRTLKGGTIGESYLCRLITDCMIGKTGHYPKDRSLLLHCHPESGLFTIREMLRDHDRIPLTHEEAITKILELTPAKPIAYRLSDYGISVRSLLEEESDLQTGIEIGYSMAYRSFNLKGVFRSSTGWFESQVRRSVYPVDESVLRSEASLVFNALVHRKASCEYELSSDYPSLQYLRAEFIARCRKRRVVERVWRMIASRMKVSTLDEAISQIHNYCLESFDPDVISRLERVAYDMAFAEPLELSEIEASEVDAAVMNEG